MSGNRGTRERAHVRVRMRVRVRSRVGARVRARVRAYTGQHMTRGRDMPEQPWWQRGVIYQIAVPSFADSDGDGLGDLRGIIGKLEYLRGDGGASLGVDAIWLTPVNASPMRDFGYDVSDYYAVNPRMGTMGDLEELLGACHERGLKLMMDLVLNHTSDEHAWFAESRSSRENPKRDWYVWADGRAPGKPPNNWVAVIEGSAWQYDDPTGQYYYHAFLEFQPDLNWHNPEVREEMLRIAEYWLGKGVDGFRLDLVNFLYEDRELRSNPHKVGARPYFWQYHVFDRSLPESIEAVRDLRRVADGYPDRALMGEVCTDRPCDSVAYLGDGTNALNLSFYLDFAMRGWSARQFRRSIAWLEENLPAGAWPCYYLNNHDIKRTFTRFGGRRHAGARARVAAAMLLTLRGTPIVYYGEELGMPESRVPRSRFNDPVGVRYWPFGKGRDGCRTPMQWTAGEHAGFTTGEPWLPLGPSHAQRNVETESADPHSLLNWYRRLIRLRSERPALHAGDLTLLERVPARVLAYARASGDERVAVFLNFGGRTTSFALPPELAEASWSTLLSSLEHEGLRHEPIAASPRAPVGPHVAGKVHLGPYETLLLVSDPATRAGA